LDPGLAALLGTGLGGLIAYLTSLVQQKRQHASERKRLLLEKVEETYHAGIAVREAFRAAWGEMVNRLSSGEFGGDRTLQKLDLDRVRMLVEVYFPDLERTLAPLEANAKDFGEAMAQSVQVIDQSADARSRMQGPLLAAFNAADGACVSFLQSVSGLSKDLLK
jgi:hypothetical protein